MSNSLKSLKAAYSMMAKKKKLPKKVTSRNNNKMPVVSVSPQIKKHLSEDFSLVGPRIRQKSEGVTFKIAAKNFLLSSVEEDVKKLQTITDKNLNFGQDMFKVKGRIMVMKMHKQMDSIREMNENANKPEPDNTNINPFDLLAEKYGIS